MIAGRGPSPYLVLSMVQRLPDTSMTVALAQGSKDHFGWGIDRHMAADLYDALNINTKVSGNWKKGKEPDFPEYPRPKTEKKKDPKQRVTVKDLYNRFTSRKR